MTAARAYSGADVATQAEAAAPGRADAVAARAPGSARPAEPARLVPRDIASNWLAWQCRMVSGCIRGALYVPGATERALVAVATWRDSADSAACLAEAARDALAGGHGVVRARARYGDGGEQIGDVVATPVVIDGQAAGAVAVLTVTRSEPQQQAILQLLQWGGFWVDHLCREFASLQRDRDATAAELALDTLTGAAPTDSAQRAAQLLAARLSCERVTVGFVRALSVTVAAISTVPRPAPGVGLTQAVAAALAEATDQDAVVRHPAEPGGPVAAAHAELATRHGLGASCSIPVHENGVVVGAILFERDAGRPFDAASVELCRRSAEAVAAVLVLARRAERSALSHVQHGLRAVATRLFGRGHLRYKVRVAALLAVVAVLAFARGDFRIAAPSVVEGAVQRAVVAPMTGYVSAAIARAGDVVHAGDVLARLDERDLQLERQARLGEREKRSRELSEALAQGNRAQVAILRAQIAQSAAELARIDDQIQRMVLHAPFDGVIVSGDLSQRLGAPVDRGQLLFEVAPLGDQRIVLEVDEHDVAFVRRGQSGELRLTGLPDQTFALSVDRIMPVAVARDGRNYFRVEARLAVTAPPIRAGMLGVAKLDVGTRPLLWIWSHDLADRLLLKVWSAGF